MKFNFEGAKKKILTTIGVAAIAGPALGQDSNINQKADMAFANPAKPKIEASFNNARKVKEVSKDYVLDHVEGNKTFYIKTTSEKDNSNESGEAKSHGPVANNAHVEHKKTFHHQGPNHISHIPSKKTHEQIHNNNEPSVDVVYTESEDKKEVDPYANYATRGESIFAPGAGGHIAAEIFYPILSTDSKTDAGMKNTQNENILVRFRNDFGFTGEVIEIPADQLPQILGGTNHFQSQEVLSELKAKASVKSKKNDTYTLDNKDLAQINNNK